MDRSFHPVDRQPEASAGKCSQAGLPLLSLVPDLQLLPAGVVSRATFNGVLNEAVRNSGLEDQQIADEIHICHGYMSRFMRGVAQQWAQRIVKFCRVTNSLAPVQWMADQLGCDLTPRAANVARIRELEAELASLTGRRAA